MFEFVSVSHPDEIKDRKKQGKLRQHAIRSGIRRSKAERAKKEGVFVPVESDARSGRPAKQTPPRVSSGGSLTNAPSLSLLDPFNTLCGCPERLRSLMRHRMHPLRILIGLANSCSVCQTGWRADLLY
jgi:hypothetical protein